MRVRARCKGGKGMEELLVVKANLKMRTNLWKAVKKMRVCKPQHRPGLGSLRIMRLSSRQWEEVKGVWPGERSVWQTMKG